ncbi:MAG: hypothetical protein ACYCYB_11895, partial [Candidatus Dormibacteria bacterium]
MSPALVTLMTFLAVVMLVVGVYSILSDLFLRDRSQISQRVDEEFRKFQRERAKRSALFKKHQALAAVDDEAGGFNLRQWFEAIIEQSGLELMPRRVLLLMTATGLGAGILGGLVRQSMLTGGIVALAGASVPLLYISYKRKVRMAKLV